MNGRKALRRQIATTFSVTAESAPMNGLRLNLKRVFVAAKVWNISPVGSFQMVEAGLICGTLEC